MDNPANFTGLNMRYLTIMKKRCYSMCVLFVISIRLTVYWPYFFRSDVCSPNAVFGQTSFRPSVRLFCVCRYLPFCYLSFGLLSLSFRLNVFRPCVHSTKCLSAKCPFGYVSSILMSVQSFVFRSSVLPPVDRSKK